MISLYLTPRKISLLKIPSIYLYFLVKVRNDGYVRIGVRHLIFMSGKIDYDMTICQNMCKLIFWILKVIVEIKNYKCTFCFRKEKSIFLAQSIS